GEATKSQLPEFENFVMVLRRDEAAVRAAASSEWSNGQTEGQVNRLKMLKRQMYGRANFDLLRARLLNAPGNWAWELSLAGSIPASPNSRQSPSAGFSVHVGRALTQVW